MERKNTPFISIFHNGKCSPAIYFENCQFVGSVLALNAANAKTPFIRDKFLNLLVKLIDEKSVESESKLNQIFDIFLEFLISFLEFFI